MKEHIRGFLTISVVLLAIVGACNIYNLIYCGLETCKLILDKQTVLLLRDQRYMIEEYNNKFAATNDVKKHLKK